MDPSYSSNLNFAVQDAVKWCTARTGPARRWDIYSTTLVSPAAFAVSPLDVKGKKLSGKPFYTVSGRIYCEEDFLYSGVHPSPEVCSSCEYLIMDMACGKSYHPSCFRCVVCRQSLEGQPFSVDTDSRVYCVSDYQRVQAPRCAACRVPILPTEGSTESIRVVSFNRNYHVECFSGEVNLI
ncbi:LIM domain-containing protein 1-like isoform X2 [Dicentrarchus labrax]|uniref:LIM domain-containing protein 1-like isoform X2 n=1 Tax=Dicentrarchus labrax TaxID=13489 RepID=UPI0021F55650|nr:LIM domain-containing protein 1-like isoform X2 [Dicentrarchus labrax]